MNSKEIKILPRKKTSIAFDDDLAKRVKKLGIDVGLDFSESLEAASLAWINAAKEGKTTEPTLPSAKAAPGPYETRHQPLHNKLNEILSSGNADQIKFVTQSVESSHEIAMRGRRKQQSG